MMLNLKGYYQSLKRKLKIKVWKGLRLSGLLTQILVLCGVKSKVKTANASNLLAFTSLDKMPLSAFINAMCYDDKRPENWHELLSEYYIVKEDDKAAMFVRIVAQMRGIQHRAKYIDVMLNAMSLYYNEDLAKELKKDFKQFKWDAETYQSDIKAAVNFEKNKILQFKALEAQLDSINNNTRGVDKSPNEVYKGLLNSIFEINKHEGHKAITLEGSTAFEYAIALGRLERHIKAINQNKA